jgi:hypothetical protein
MPLWVEGSDFPGTLPTVPVFPRGTRGEVVLPGLDKTDQDCLPGVPKTIGNLCPLVSDFLT